MIVGPVAAKSVDIAIWIGKFVRSSFVFDQADEYILRQVFCQMRIVKHLDEESVALIPVFFK